MKPNVQETIAQFYKADPELDFLLARPELRKGLSAIAKLSLARYQESKNAAEAVAQRKREAQR